MTEQIKDSMETCRIIVHATEEELLNQHRYNDAKEIEFALKDMLKAFRSLNAWEEVLQELETENIFWTRQAFKHKDDEFAEGKAFGLSKAIDIIKQKLEGVTE